MAIWITNSLAGKKEEFTPKKAGEVRMYVCGVTVYDQSHIGHARSAFIFDVIRRYFRYSGYHVKFVKNVTDIDDKIINKAKEEFPGLDLKEASKKVAEKYLASYHADMKKLGIEEPDVEPKATAHLKEMFAMIDCLIKKGYAYQAGGSVYFDVKKFKKYGKLSNQSIEQMESGPPAGQAGVRVEAEKEKRDPLDFALWKAAKENEPSWESPWGKGRPGWHIECSAMSTEYLGENFDIHCGGRDLIFPHHENEIAQAEACTGKTFANYWMHNGLLTINSQKMAKSLGNFVTVVQVLEKYHPEVLKIFFLQAHYTSPTDFTFEKMEEAKKARERLYNLLDRIDRLEATSAGENTELISFDMVDDAKWQFREAMDDDFNTPEALSSIFELVGKCYKFLQEVKDITEEDIVILKYAKAAVLELGRVLGLFFREFEEGAESENIEALMNLVVELRDNLRAQKNFELTDKIRAELTRLGFILEDEKGKTIWRKAR